MRVSLQVCKIPFPQKEVPNWSKNVDRWYQLDAYAFSLCEVLARFDYNDFDQMVLASPGASTETDFHFCQSELPSPQKFVHTLPNVRAAMGLQAIGKKAELICLQKAPFTIKQGIEEFLDLCSEDKNPLLTSCFNLSNDYALHSSKSYGVLALTQDRKGGWELKETGLEDLTDQQIIDNFSDSQNTIELGPWKLEKYSEY